MRIFLLPISTRRTLIYCQPRPSTTQSSISDKIIARASKAWTDLEKADSGWKKKLTTLGNGIFARLPFEEWGLKTLPAYSAKTIQEATETRVVFPGGFLRKEGVLELLGRLGTERQALHKRKMVWSVLAMPLTIPVGILPVIPNIPLFYLAFRAYSHYKALNGGRYLEHILNKKLVTPEPSDVLDRMYAAGLMHPTREQARAVSVPTVKDVGAMTKEIAAKGQDEEVMLLRRWNGKLLAERLELPDMEIEIERAVEQVQKAIEEQAKAEREKRSAELGLVKKTHESIEKR